MVSFVLGYLLSLQVAFNMAETTLTIAAKLLYYLVYPSMKDLQEWIKGVKETIQQAYRHTAPCNLIVLTYVPTAVSMLLLHCETNNEESNFTISWIHQRGAERSNKSVMKVVTDSLYSQNYSCFVHILTTFNQIHECVVI